MKNLAEWFSEYGESHKNKINKLIHWICIPLIFWSIIALFSLIPHSFMDIFINSLANDLMHWGTILIFIGLIFYLKHSLNIFLGMLFFSLLVLIDIYYTVHFFDLHKYWGVFDSFKISGEKFLLIISVIIFIFAWILQFIGHQIEGAKPSFLKDIQFLLIGPAWLLGFIYQKNNIKI